MHKTHPPLLIISGAIGSGKGTITHALEKEMGFHWIPSHTTRAMRKEDKTLSRRIYDSEPIFHRHIERGDFIEWIKLAGNYYGLLRHDLEKELKMNHPVVVELTVDGGIKLAKAYPSAVLIFLSTPEKYRQSRIQRRGMSREEREERMRDAKRETIVAQRHYDYIIENHQDDVQEAIEEIKKILTEEFPELNVPVKQQIR